VAGHSAGAHLAALVCTDDRYLKAEGLTLANIKGCFPVDTAAYVVPKQVAGVGGLRSETYTGVFGSEETAQKEISPITRTTNCCIELADLQIAWQMAGTWCEKIYPNFGDRFRTRGNTQEFYPNHLPPIILSGDKQFGIFACSTHCG